VERALREGKGGEMRGKNTTELHDYGGIEEGKDLYVDFGHAHAKRLGASAEI
jgi:hypothetical protein